MQRYSRPINFFERFDFGTHEFVEPGRNDRIEWRNFGPPLKTIFHAPACSRKLVVAYACLSSSQCMKWRAFRATRGNLRQVVNRVDQLALGCGSGTE